MPRSSARVDARHADLCSAPVHAPTLPGPASLAPPLIHLHRSGQLVRGWEAGILRFTSARFGEKHPGGWWGGFQEALKVRGCPCSFRGAASCTAHAPHAARWLCRRCPSLSSPPLPALLPHHAGRRPPDAGGAPGSSGAAPQHPSAHSAWSERRARACRQLAPPGRAAAQHRGGRRQGGACEECSATPKQASPPPSPARLPTPVRLPLPLPPTHLEQRSSWSLRAPATCRMRSAPSALCRRSLGSSARARASPQAPPRRRPLCRPDPTDAAARSLSAAACLAPGWPGAPIPTQSIQLSPIDRLNSRLVLFHFCPLSPPRAHPPTVLLRSRLFCSLVLSSYPPHRPPTDGFFTPPPF